MFGLSSRVNVGVTQDLRIKALAGNLEERVGGQHNVQVKEHSIPLRWVVNTEQPGDSAPGLYPNMANRMRLAPLRAGFFYVLDATESTLQEIPLTGRIADLEQAAVSLPQGHRGYVSYAEVAWSETKKQQILNDPEERNAFLHPLKITRTRQDGLGVQLDTLAPFEDEHYEQTAWVERTKTLYQEHEAEYGRGKARLLIIPDDIGVLRDLSEAQQDTLEAMSDWLEEDDRQTRYQVGAFVESLTALEDSELIGLAEERTFAHNLKPLVDHTQSTPDANVQTQRLTELAAYLNDQHTPPDLKALRDHHVQSTGQFLSSAHEQEAFILDCWRDWLIEHLPSFDSAFIRRNVMNFESAKTAYQRHHKALLKGENFGSRGVNDVIDRDAMRQFMVDYRAELPLWNERLSRISHDRVQLITAHAFHRAAWYFDITDETQRQHAEDAEYICIRDLAREDVHLEQLAQYSEAHPDIMLLGAFTLPKAQQNELALLLNNALLTLSHYPKLEQFIGQYLPNITRELANDLQGMIKDQYRAFVAHQQQQLANQMLSAIRQRLATHSVESLFRVPAILQVELAEALAMQRIQLDQASPQQVARFHQDLGELEQQRGELTRLRHQIRQTAAGLRQRNIQERQARLNEQKNAFKATQARLTELEGTIQRGLLPVDVGEVHEGRVGYGVRLNNQEDAGSLRTIVHDATEVGRTSSMSLANERAFQRALNVLDLSRWDALGVILFGLQIRNTMKAYSEYITEKAETGEEDRSLLFQSFAATSATGASLIQGLGAGLMIARLDHASQGLRVKLGALHMVTGFATYGLGVAVSAAATAQSKRDLAHALESGDAHAVAAATLRLGANAGLTGVYGLGWGITFIDGLRARSAFKRGGVAAFRQSLMVSGARLSTLFVRLNLVGVALTLIELGASYWYNQRNLTPLNQWLLQSIWGKEPSHASMDVQLQHLQTALYQPPTAQLTTAHGNVFVELTIPSLSLSTLAEQGELFSLAVGYSQAAMQNQWLPWSLEFMLNCEPVPNTNPHGPLTLRYFLTVAERNAQHGLVLTVVERAGNHTEHRTHLQSRTLSLAAPPSPLNPFSRGTDTLEAKHFDTVVVPVSHDRLSGHQPIALRTLRLFHDIG